jgi:hypothetical protein
MTPFRMSMEATKHMKSTQRERESYAKGVKNRTKNTMGVKNQTLAMKLVF